MEINELLMERAELTEEELAEINDLLIETWKRTKDILGAKDEDIVSEMADANYMYWLCFTVGMFRENPFMKETFGGNTMEESKELLMKLEEVEKAYR